MTVEAGRAIYFDCEKCDHVQYTDYSLGSDWEGDRAVMADNIVCEKCGHENRVIEEI